MNATRVPFDVESFHRRRAPRWIYFLAGLALGFVGGAAFMLAGIHQSWGL